MSDQNSSINSGGKPAGDPIPGEGEVNITFGKSKIVYVNVATFGDRPTYTSARTPSPSSPEEDTEGHAHLGPYDVAVSWPVGAADPTVTITP